MSSLDYLDLCRLCLVKDRVSVPIFEGEGDVRQIFLKIAACLPVKVAREDKLPKKICDDCVYKVELFYQFWNTTANSEKQLLQWLGEVNLEDKQGYVTNVMNQNVLKPEQSNTENRLDGTVMQQVDGQNNLGIGMMDNMSLGIPMIISSANQQEITSVPMDTGGNSVQTVQAVPGPSTQTTHNQMTQNQTSTTQQEEDEESSEEDENTDEECDAEEGLPVKEENEDSNANRTIEPTTFVNVSLACDEAGPSGLQQQKIAEMPEMAMTQSTDGDPKSGAKCRRKGVIVQDSNGRLRLVLIRSQESNEVEGNTTTLNGSQQVQTIENATPLIRVVQELATPTPISLIRKTPATSVKEVQNSSKRGTRRTLETEMDNVDTILSSLQNTCPFCQKIFDDSEKVQTHVKRIHRIPYKCDKCFQGFHTEEGLELHKAKHQEKRVYECDICHLKWVQEKSLMIHKLRHHSTQTAEYICEHCGKTFHVERDLDYHIKRNHLKESDEPAFEVCQYCGKQVKSIRGHEWLHYKEIIKEKKRFPCHLCKKRFCDQVRLDRHLVRHSNGIKCEECGKEYPGRQELTNHRRRRHGQGTYLTCVVCQKTFAIGYYYLHVLTHAGIRPYKCDICEENFTQRTTLLRHRKQHPGPLPPEPPSNPHIVYLAKKYLQELQESQMDEDSVANEHA